MLPARLTAASFANYPPQAGKLAVAHLALFQQLPLGFLPSLLRELIDYDSKFPAERSSMDQELAYLSGLSRQHTAECMKAFSQLHLSSSQEKLDWVNHPLGFTEQFSAYLWSTDQMNAFRDAATAYGKRIRAADVHEPLPVSRLGIAVIGQGVTDYDGRLFHNLRDHGTYFSNIHPQDGLRHLLSAVESRAQAHPSPYGHWYVDGGVPQDSRDSALTCVSYASLAHVRDVLLQKIQSEVAKPGMGPEELRDFLARLSPGEVGMAGDAMLDRFQIRILTEGSGTQIFSTTFAQWTAREVLRRAEALTLLVRFAPRQRQRPMNELLSQSESPVELDPLGSLIDADMAAYYQWINQQRLHGSEQGSFLVWFEGHNQAMAIGPSFPRGAESKSSLTLEAFVSLATG